MAYITPDSTVVLINNMHIDPTYTDTIWFDNRTQQQEWFYTHRLREFTAQHYVRVNGNKIRLDCKPSDVYNVNYMMFKNNAYNEKWFYAFVLQADYINDNTTEITFEIDVMQTWLFEAQLEPCFIERETSATDVAGDNLLAEPVDLGDIIAQEITPLAEWLAYDAVVAYATTEGSSN